MRGDDVCEAMSRYVLATVIAGHSARPQTWSDHLHLEVRGKCSKAVPGCLNREPG